MTRLAASLVIIVSLLLFIEGNAAVRSPCPRATRITTNSHYRGRLHFICIQAEPNRRPRLDVIEYPNLRLVWSQEIEELGTDQLASFVDNDGALRILLAVPRQVNGTSMYELDVSGKMKEEKHTVNTQLVSTLNVWKLELNWQWHLAIANRPDNDLSGKRPATDEGTMITIHSWKSTYFDRYQILNLPYGVQVNKLEPMHINDQEFLIVACEPSGGSTQSSFGSPIYKLDFGDGSLEWRKFQSLDTKLAIDASSFMISHEGSVQIEYYIALIGQLHPSRERMTNMRVNPNVIDGAESSHGIIIYKYFGDQFVNTHQFSVPGATKLDTITYGQGDSYVVIALLSSWSNEISLFMFDGLNITPLPSPRPRLALPPGSRVPPFNRNKRTMESSLHLFRMPSSGANNDSSVKRTLDDTAQNIELPALAFSSISDGQDSGNSSDESANDDDQENLYEIPLDEHIKKEQDTSHTKRNFINQLAGSLGDGRDLLGWCKSQMDSLLTDNFDLAAQQLSSLPRVDQSRPIHIMGDLEIDGDLHVSNVLYANRVDDGRVLASPFLPTNASQTFNELERTHMDIDALMQRVDQILVDDDSVQNVHVPLRFQRIVFECLNPINTNPRLHPLAGLSPCPQVGELLSNYLNGRNISDIQRQALISGRSMKVGQEVRFEHLVLHGNTTIHSTLNHIPIDEIIFGKSRRPVGIIPGHKNFQNRLYTTANLAVENWNGQRIDQQTVLTSTGDQRIEANLRFSQVVFDTMPVANYSSGSRIELLNGLHLDAHLDQIAQLDSDNKFELPVAFDELIVNGPTHFSHGSHLSRVDLEDLWMNVLFGHSHQNITAPMEFRDVHVSYGGDIHADEVNGVTLNPDAVMMRNRDYDMPNPVLFDSDLNVRLLHLEKALNGIQVFPNPESNRPELALLYDGGSQILTGDKILNEVQLGGYNNIAGLINGHMNLTQLSLLARNEGPSFRFSNVKLAHRQIRVAPNAQVQVDSLINGIPVNDICAFANSLVSTSTNPYPRIYNRLKFDKQPIVFKQLRCASINGFNELRNSFMMKYANQRIAGTLKLVNGLIFNSTVNIGTTLNNLDIRPLSTAISRALNETRTGHKDIYGDFIIDDLSVDSINDLQLSDVLVTKSDFPQYVRAPLIFDHLDIENVLVVGKDLMAKQFNGLNVSDIFTNTLQYDVPQVVYNHVELDNMQILPGSNLVTKSVNEVSISQLYADAVLVDVGQQILAPKRFKNPTDFINRVSLRYGIDRLSENELKFNLLLQSDELIEDDLEFDNDVTVMESLEIQSGQINDIDVNLFVNSMLYENRPNGFRMLENSSLFFKDVKLSDLVVTGTIQGYDLSREALQKGDNVNGTYDALIRQQQIARNNQEVFNRLYNSGAPFYVRTKFDNEVLQGSCSIQTCPQARPYETLSQIYQSTNMSQPPKQLMMQHIARPLFRQDEHHQPAPWIGYNPRPHQQQQKQSVPLRPIYSAAIMPVLPAPMALVNATKAQQWHPIIQRPTSPSSGIGQQLSGQGGEDFALIDPRYLEHLARLKANAIRDLSSRVNEFLSVSFYYDMMQTYPGMGPALHVADSPDAFGTALLLLKSVTKRGEPCLQSGQKIDVLLRVNNSFSTRTTIQDTSRPGLVDSIKVGDQHYLFVNDLQSDVNENEFMSHILVYHWNRANGMYDSEPQIPIEGAPTVMKAFVLQNQLACLALANPMGRNESHKFAGAPVLYCQTKLRPRFQPSARHVIPISNIFDLDVFVLPGGNGMQVLVAALSRQDLTQIGDLIIARYDIGTRQIEKIFSRRIARPIRLHFVTKSPRNTDPEISLVVAEGITSNDAAQATTRVFSVNVFNRPIVSETQLIRDNQFVDIQSVLLDDKHPMIFMRSTNSISIYAHLPSVGSVNPACAHFQLVQRLPTKGANKFLVFNSSRMRAFNGTLAPLEHVLVLSRDDCANQEYKTWILKSEFV